MLGFSENLMARRFWNQSMGILNMGTAKLLNTFGWSLRKQGLMYMVLFCFIDNEEKLLHFTIIAV